MRCSAASQPAREKAQATGRLGYLSSRDKPTATAISADRRRSTSVLPAAYLIQLFPLPPSAQPNCSTNRPPRLSIDTPLSSSASRIADESQRSHGIRTLAVCFNSLQKSELPKGCLEQAKTPTPVIIPVAAASGSQSKLSFRRRQLQRYRAGPNDESCAAPPTDLRY